MYPNIPPEVELRETLSSPHEPAKVVGFVGRNKKLGRTAVVMKDEAIIGGDGKNPVVEISKEQAEILDDEPSELLVLHGDEVLVIEGTEFAAEARSPTVNRGGTTVEMLDISLSNSAFKSFPRGQVTVEN